MGLARWPPEWQVIKNATPPNFTPSLSFPDRIIWTRVPNGIFSIKSAWDSIRSHGPPVYWHSLVWHKKAIPRHAMILWLAVKGRFRLASFGISQDISWGLCCTAGLSLVF